MDLLYNAGHLEAQDWAILMISQAYIGDYVGVVHYKYCVHGEYAMTGLERKRYLSEKGIHLFRTRPSSIILAPAHSLGHDCN
jgi:hypothetical protein